MDFLKSNIRIVQMSQTRSGSTLLTNILYGLFQPDLPVFFCGMGSHLGPFIDNNFILKTHSEEPLKINTNFPQYTIYYIASIRPSLGKTNHQKYIKTVPRFRCVHYDLLNTKVELAVQNTVHILKLLLPFDLIKLANQKTAIKRIHDMNERYEQIKELGFHDYFDPFYKIHGHHRNRDDILGRPDK